jgi:transmembrane sensor
LEYVDAPLRDIVADANRYSSEPIVIADEQLANVRVSVTYRSDHVPEMLSALSQSLTIDVEQAAGGGVVLLPHERTN